MDNETLANKFDNIKGNVKKTWDKTSDADKSKVKDDLQKKDYSGAADTVKKNFNNKT